MREKLNKKKYTYLGTEKLIGPEFVKYNVTYKAGLHNLKHAHVHTHTHISLHRHTDLYLLKALSS